MLNITPEQFNYISGFLQGDGNHSEIFMDRKHNIFIETLKWKRTTPKLNGKRTSWLPSEKELLLNSNYSISDKMCLLKRSKSSIRTQLWRLKQVTR